MTVRHGAGYRQGLPDAAKHREPVPVDAVEIQEDDERSGQCCDLIDASRRIGHQDAVPVIVELVAQLAPERRILRGDEHEVARRCRGGVVAILMVS
jgi:hypothetical protein